MSLPRHSGGGPPEPGSAAEIAATARKLDPAKNSPAREESTDNAATVGRLSSAEEARALTDKIKGAIDDTLQLIQQAWCTQAWLALGYPSWDDYCTREFRSSRLWLPREEQQEVVVSLREVGMSNRAVAAATGTSKSTVNRMLSSVSGQPSGVPNGTRSIVDRPSGLRAITGTDGKTYRAQPARTPNRRALPPQFRSAAIDLSRAIGRFEQLQKDERCRRNRPAIADQCLPDIRRAIEILNDLKSYYGRPSEDERR